MFQLIGEPVSNQNAYIFYGREIEDLIPGAMIEFLTDGPENLFHVGEVHDHPGNGVGLNHKFEFVSMSVKSPAFRVVRKKMGAIDKFGNTQTHERTPVVIIAEWESRKIFDETV